MWQIVEILAPILLLLILGAALARARFLGRQFMADLNRLIFYISLPSLIFTSVATAGEPVDRTLTLVAVMATTTLVIAFLSWGLAAWPLKIPTAAIGTFVQGAFRGNLMLVGLPVLSYAFAELPAGPQRQVMATIFLIITPIMVLYNILSVTALQASHHQIGAGSYLFMIRSILTNPLILACAVGGVFMVLKIPVPVIFDRTLETLGAAAVPIALLCIGGSLTAISLRGSKRAIIACTALKLIASPLLAALMGWGLHLSAVEMRIVVVLAACPIAAAAYIMARQMNGDEALASGSLALSTICAAPVIGLALYLTH